LPHLKTADSTTAFADGGTTPKVHDGWMWDLTISGNDHDFYVVSSQADAGRSHDVEAALRRFWSTIAEPERILTLLEIRLLLARPG
jgi:hypothetical protein